MIIKELISRIVHKSDVEKRWQLAVDFVPLRGEIIIYDRDDNIEDEAFKGTYSYARFKIGDGVTKVNDLPFANSSNFIGPDSPDNAPDGSFWVDTDEEGGFKITVNGIEPDENGNIEIEVTDPYELPVGGNELGGVKNGGNVVIDATGAMNVEVPSIEGLATEEYVDAAIEAIPKVEVNYPVVSVNGQTGAVNLDAEAVGALPKDTVIPTVPTNVSAFVNDAGYLTQHQSLAGLATENYVDEVAGDLQDNIDALSSAVELLTNGVDAETVDGVNDLIVYVNEHGAEVTGMKADIKANADALAELAPVAKTGSWNDLVDRPTNIEEGLYIQGPDSTSGVFFSMGLYKISDQAPAIEDFANGCTVKWNTTGSTQTYSASEITVTTVSGLPNVIQIGPGIIIVVPVDTTHPAGTVFTAGTYAREASGGIAHIITTPTKETFKKEMLEIEWNDILNKPVVDSALSSTSTNPVQNKVVYSKYNSVANLASNAKSTAEITKTYVGTLPSDSGATTVVGYIDNRFNQAMSMISATYTKAEIDNMEFITLDEIDAICARTIEVVTPTTGSF